MRGEQLGLRGVGIADLQVDLRQLDQNGAVCGLRLRRISQLDFGAAKITLLFQLMGACK